MGSDNSTSRYIQGLRMSAKVTSFEESLIQYLRLNLSELSDFTIVSQEKQEFKCNRLLLAARSKYYEALFRQEPDKTTSKLAFNGNLLRVILKSLVTAQFDDCNQEELLQLIEVVDFLQMPEMASEIEIILSSQLSLDNIYPILASTEQYIQGLTVLKHSVALLVKENILSLDLTR